jgi:hypothetical protein
MQQHIRRKCDPELFEAIASNRRMFDVRVDNEDVQIDDFYTFVETVEDESQREVYRRVSYIVRTNDLPENVRADVDRHGLAIVGFVPADYGSIAAMLAEGSIAIAFAVEIKEKGQYEIVEGPAVLPILASPQLNIHQVMDTIGVAVWPEGLYSVMLGCHLGPVKNDVTQDVTLHEIIVLVRTLEDDEDRFVQVDHRFLIAGSIHDLSNNVVVPHFGGLELESEFRDAELDPSALDCIIEAEEEG